MVIPDIGHATGKGPSMYRKRLLGLFAAFMLAASAGPAAALESISTDAASQEAVAVTEAATSASDLDPEVDESIEGVGRIYVDVDEDEGTLTVGLGIEPLGFDETVVLPPAGGGDDDGTSQETVSPQDTARANEKAAMDATKAEAAQDAPRPAFARGSNLGSVSGSVNSGAGVTGSTRAPTVSATPDGNTATGPLSDANANPWLKLMGVVMLAGTSTAWSIARREGLA